MSITIKSISGRELYIAQSATDVRAAVTEAVKRGADLRGADLRGADLRGADLRGADLRGADLRGADLRGADLRGADLRGADLRGAYLRDADLRDADLRGADLRDAYLQGADLRGADLRDAYLRDAYLQGAYLRGADLQGAYLQGADLQGAKNAEIAIAKTRILPDEGDIIGWKKARDNHIVKLLIPADAQRSHASGRKCRASKAVVVAIYDGDKELSEATSSYDSRFRYRVGETVTPTKPFDEDMWNECSTGLHFYITRIEAEHHV